MKAGSSRKKSTAAMNVFEELSRTSKPKPELMS
jgi:hypothetical protein